jgi:hypothetical protein
MSTIGSLPPSYLGKSPLPAPPAAPSPLGDRFERQAEQRFSIGEGFRSAGEVVGDIGPLLGGMIIGVGGIASSGLVLGIAAGFLGAGAIALFAGGLRAIGNAFARSGEDKQCLAQVAKGTVPSMSEATIQQPDGSRIRIGISDYHGMGSSLLCHVTAFRPGESAPYAEVLTRRAFLDNHVGELHARGKTVDGRAYKVNAAFPQVSAESFDFSQPVAAEIQGPK